MKERIQVSRIFHEEWESYFVPSSTRLARRYDGMILNVGVRLLVKAQAQRHTT